MQNWHELVRAALVGVDRTTVAFNADEPLVGDLLAQLDISQPDVALLKAAALMAPVQRAGYIPATAADELLSEAEAESYSYVSERAAQDLPLLISNRDYQPVFLEWLNLAAEQKRLVPPAYLPDLLQYGAAHDDFRGAIRNVMGERGRWLAELNPTWAYMARRCRGEIDLVDDAARDRARRVWASSAIQTRVRLLEYVRQQDPEFGLELLAGSWQKETGADRAVLLPCLAIGINSQDEPLLESALDDRSMDVRPIARKLLVKLPQSRFSARMIGHVSKAVGLERQPLLSRIAGFAHSGIQGAGTGRYRLVFQPPADRDPSMIRDLIIHHDPQWRMKDRIYWTHQIVALAPLNHWTSAWELTPAEVVNADCDPEYRLWMLLGWAYALGPQDEPEWAHALFTAFLDEFPHDDLLQKIPWIDFLPSAVIEQAVLRLLPLEGKDNERGMQVLAGALRSWSAGFSRAFLGAIAESPRDMWQIAHIAAGRLPDAMLGDFWSLCDRAASGNLVQRPGFDRLREREEFRRPVLRRLREKGAA